MEPQTDATAFEPHAHKPDGQLSSMENAMSEDLGLLAQVHNIVIPPIPCSFHWRNHPDNRALKEVSEAWLLARFTNIPGADGRPSSFAAEHLIKSAFYLLATLSYPDGISERMPQVMNMMCWIFVMDTVLDDSTELGADPERADKLVESWWRAVCHQMPPKQKARLRKAVCDFLEASLTQVSLCMRLLLTLLWLIVSAANFQMWKPIFQSAQGFELDDEALAHPLFLEFHKNWIQHISITNDVISFKKEYMEGDFFNIVSLLYFQKLYDPQRNSEGPAPTLQDAILEAVEMIKERDSNCLRLMQQIRECKELISTSGMEQYLVGASMWLSGSVYWHLRHSCYVKPRLELRTFSQRLKTSNQ
ncbi:hypothetical protein KP509_34G055500 [Ceratopteris richardii]|uniref:Terpene synthase n=1 Tax=Ceratopteris richardii TaxID=49495 RepID=A0A8T2QK00_CERRI|nr:hypothetical protein KP509_34G055500 [Ceratopteris richardii]